MDFPYLSDEDDFEFPPCSAEDSLVAVGGNLSPGMLLSAYRRGIFPWYSDDTSPVLWHSPDPRFVLFPKDLHTNKKFRSFMKKQVWSVRLDYDFANVITHCSRQPRRGQAGTWITKNMQQAYLELHDLGFAHSCEVYENDEFIGGLYGINLGKIFFGESMVSLKSQASKYAFVKFTEYFTVRGLDLIDCQQESDYLGSMGAVNISRDTFQTLVHAHSSRHPWRGNWAVMFSDFS